MAIEKITVAGSRTIASMREQYSSIKWMEKLLLPLSPTPSHEMSKSRSKGSILGGGHHCRTGKIRNSSQKPSPSALVHFLDAAGLMAISPIIGQPHRASYCPGRSVKMGLYLYINLKFNEPNTLFFFCLGETGPRPGMVPKMVH
jgi:hypothetical protein